MKSRSTHWFPPLDSTSGEENVYVIVAAFPVIPQNAPATHAPTVPLDEFAKVPVGPATVTLIAVYDPAVTV